MALEICAMLATLYCAFTPELPPAAPATVETVALQPSSRMPELCLVAGRSCLDLSDARFAPCLANAERCKPDVGVRKLVSTPGQLLPSRR